MADQAQRIVFMLKKFQTGHKFTTTEVHEMVNKEFGEHSLRTVQRDMLLLQECEPAITFTKVGKENLWYIPREVRNSQAILRIDNNELLSLYALKAHLKTFAGTIIEEDANRLTEKLEKFAPNEVFPASSIFWDQNIGYYDYSRHSDLIKEIISCIAEKQWLRVGYNASSKGYVRDIVVLLRCLFSFSGAVYAVAYVPKHDTHIALSIQNIDTIQKIDNDKVKAPDFDFKDWSSNRFGVFFGEMKRVTLSVLPEFKHYFMNRKWHPSQIINEEMDGSLTIELKVPIGADFLAWVMSWGSAIKVIKPDELIQAVRENFQEAIDSYNTK